MTTRIAVVGAGGCVGREMLSLLEKYGLSETPPTLFGSAASRRKNLPFGDRELPVRCLDEESLEGFDLVLCATGADVSRAWAPRFASSGAVVVDNSSAFRLHPEVPLVVPEVNKTEVRRSPGILANPNCSSILLVLALHPLTTLGRFRVVVSTYQAVSGAGRAGLEALERERAGGSFQPDAPFPFPIQGNLFPVIGPVDARGDTGEELKMVHESRKILDRPDLEIYATCVRVPVARCHSEAVTLIFEQPVDPVEATEQLRSAPGLELVEEADAPPTPLGYCGRHPVGVGRLRFPAPNVLQMWLVGDQLLKGAALNAVEIGRIALSNP